MPTSDRFEGAKPPSPPRLKSTDLPKDMDGQAVEPEPFLSGHPILPEDMDIADLTQAQLYEMNQRLLEESMESERPLISPPEATSVLRNEYSNSPDFLAQIETLINRGYNIIIRAKGDGDCFYRALAFAYLDRLMRFTGHSNDRLAATTDMLAKAGFDECVYDQPYEMLQSLAQLRASRTNAREELWQSFTDPATSNYIVMYMRLLTSAQMRIDVQFADFLFDPESQMQTSVDDFCRRFVEPLGKEADHVQVAALAQALDVHVKVAYLDGHAADGQVNFVDFSENASHGGDPLLLLYRPGHYDILQKSA
ncbi:peptidase C65 Otubain-domain-containing protein [Boletus reticuloceps]|uniref:ubiquitinyl hydrolase 1 n=1 Tax=Boletus reticuloceps TaxID=495285 RepID=A0A8I2YLL7_9AGAM|nr:peptidase C65 Otubain-domain-containing protein [Boletus reticuloceps]